MLFCCIGDGCYRPRYRKIARRTGKSGTAWAPQVEFTDTAGDIVRFIDNVASKPPEFHVGEGDRVAYSPQRAEIESFRGRWLLLLIPRFIGTLFLLIGGGLVAGVVGWSRRR